MAFQPPPSTAPLGVSDPEEVAALLRVAISDGRCQERRTLSRAVQVKGSLVEAVVVEKIFGTASGARLVRFLPEGRRWVWKNGDVRLEHAIMCALRHMNGRWKRAKLAVCGQLVQAVTFEIVPLGASAGLVEAIASSWTLRELSQQYGHTDQRVLVAIRKDPHSLDRLAATTVAYLTAGYTLGIRDGHDDNLMVRSDGAFFRVDFGWAFGATPEIDAPMTFVPKAVAAALGELRWEAVVACCRVALIVLSDPLPSSSGSKFGEFPRDTGSYTGAKRSGSNSTSAADGSSSSSSYSYSCSYSHPNSSSALDMDSPPGWHCLSRVQELLPWESEAAAHCATLTLEDFCDAVSCANQWSLTRLAKNTLREVARLWTHGGDPDADLSSDDGEAKRGERIVYVPRGVLPQGYPTTIAPCHSANSPALVEAVGHGQQVGIRAGSAASSAWPRPRQGSDSDLDSGFGAQKTATVAATPPIVSAFDPGWVPLPPGDPFARTPPGSPRTSSQSSQTHSKARPEGAAATRGGGPFPVQVVGWATRQNGYEVEYGKGQGRPSSSSSSAGVPPSPVSMTAVTTTRVSSATPAVGKTTVGNYRSSQDSRSRRESRGALEGAPQGWMSGRPPGG